MHDWQDVVDHINDRDRPVRVFFRDDDAGWANQRLEALCARFADNGVELDLAVIPAALDSDAQETLHRVLRRHGELLHLHQHGYRHCNYQQTGRKYEFGSDRNMDLQHIDIAKGKDRLQEIFGELIEPVFTPPWNRCTSATCEVLDRLNFTGLSRITGSADIDHHGLADLSPAVDWEKTRSGVHLSQSAFLNYTAGHFARDDVVGIMLHHAMMDHEALERIGAFLKALRGCARVEWCSMMQSGCNQSEERLRVSLFA